MSILAENQQEDYFGTLQYVADSHLKIIQQHGIIQSMSRKGNCWDNAVAESFFATLKNELVYQQKFNTREEAKQAIF